MPTYSIFGEHLDSEITIPELRRARTNGSSWSLRVTTGAPASNHAELLGTLTIVKGVNARFYKLPNGYRLCSDDTGTFDISRDGREIVWFRGPQASLDAARSDILSHVLPLAFQAAGFLCLHGSAVCIDHKAIAFLAPSYHGKSTLAIAMAEVGARILADDVVAVDVGPPVIARPGVHSVRLLDDSARALIGEADRLRAVGAYPWPRRDQQQIPAGEPMTTKQVLGSLPPDKLMLDAVPLVAIYLLRPVRDTGGADAATRTNLPPVRAALSLVEQAKSVALLGKTEAPALFNRAVAVARNVPVYLLELVRELHRLPDVARQLTQWTRGGNS